MPKKLSQTLTNTQIEILEDFPVGMTTKELLSFRKYLLLYLKQKIDVDVDAIIKKKKIDQSKLDITLNTHIKRKK